MKGKALLSLTLLAHASSQATAECAGTQVTDAVGTQETAVVTFQFVLFSRSATVAGWTFTANPFSFSPFFLGANAPQVAAAFGSGSSGVGTFAGVLTGWTRGPASGSTVTFTSTSVGNVPDIVVSGTGNVSTTDGVDGAPYTLSELLYQKTVCVSSGASWEAQEFHGGSSSVGGPLIDWKRGPVDPIDPTEQVGTWNISGTGTDTKVNYVYGSTTYSNSVWDHGDGTYSFCNQLGNETIATIKAGQVACTP